MKLNISANRLILYNSVMLTVGVALAFVLLIGGYAALSAAAKVKPPAQAATVTLQTVPPVEPVCPGSHIEYKFIGVPLRAPIVVRHVITFWSVERNESVEPQILGEQRVAIWLDANPITTIESYRIPTHDRHGVPLSPGPYELRVAIVAEATAPSVFALPVKLRECPS